MEAYSNVELNSFLTHLTNAWDEPAAQAVVDTFHTLPVTNKVVKIRTKIKQGASMTGHTDEVGNVTIKDQEVKQTIKGEKREDFARVGYYKIKHERSGNAFLITWHNFWASDPTTMSSTKTPLPLFGVAYETTNLTPLALIRWDFQQSEVKKMPLWDRLHILLERFRGFCTGAHITFEHISYVAQPTVIFVKHPYTVVR